MAKVVFTPNIQRHVELPQAEASGRTVRPEASLSGNATWRWIFGVKTTLAIVVPWTGQRVSMELNRPSPCAGACCDRPRLFWGWPLR